MKHSQLLLAVFLVLTLLVVVFESSGGPLALENTQKFFERKVDAFAQLLHEALDGGVHDAAKGERRARSIFHRPKICKGVLLRAPPVLVHLRRAQLERLRTIRMKGFGPVSCLRKNPWSL